MLLKFQSLLGNDKRNDYINNKLSIFIEGNLLFYHASCALFNFFKLQKKKRKMWLLHKKVYSKNPLNIC